MTRTEVYKILDVEEMTLEMTPADMLAELRKATALGIACFEQFGVPAR